MTRGRKPLLVPSRAINTRLNETLAAEIEALLFSKAEGRVPLGAYQAFFTEAAIFQLRREAFDLGPYSGSMPGEHIIYTFPGTREVLQKLLERRKNANQS